MTKLLCGNQIDLSCGKIGQFEFMKGIVRSEMVKHKYLACVWFVLGFGLFMFTRMSRVVPSIPIAILIAPVFILRFSRTQPVRRGIWLTLLGFLLSMNIALWGLFQFDEASLMAFHSLIRSSLLAVLWFLPYMTDRLIYPKFKGKGGWSTLTFPIITTAIFFISSLEGPFDDGGGTSSSFSYGSLTFLQAMSLSGIWVYVFIYSWVASVINYFWENQFRWIKMKKLVILYPAVLLSVFIFGVLKTSLFTSPKSDTVKIAAVVLLPEDGKAVRMERIFNQKAASPFEETIARIEDAASKAVANGAKIVSFQEFAMTIDEKDESKLMDRYQRMAKENSVYLSMTYAYFTKEGKGENKHLFIDNNGKVQLNYAKRYLFGFGPFGETAVFKKGPTIIQSTDTPYGKIGISICRDMAFSPYLRQAARDKVDIMLSPSYDWPKSPVPWYLSSTVENGFSLVRPTYNGCTYAADYHGNVLATMDSDETEDGIMYADVPTKGIRTAYSLIGDSLGWLCVFGLVAFVALSIIGKNNDTS